MKHSTTQRIAIVVALAALAVVPFHHAAATASTTSSTATVYYNEACGDCAEYLTDDLRATLRDAGVPIVVRDYVNEPEVRGEMLQFAEGIGMPLELRSHLPTVIRDARGEIVLVLGGHVPAPIIRDALARAPEENGPRYIMQEVMLGMGDIDRSIVQYGLWAPGYAMMWFPLDTPYADAATKFASSAQKTTVAPLGIRSLLGLVISSGFVDGLNPCAFAVLLFFISFLYALKRSHRAIALTGLTYILGVYVAYLGIGFGLLKAIELTFAPHFMAKLGAWLTITIGVWGLLKFVVPMPSFRWHGMTKDAARYWLSRATIPTAFVGGFLVGLCTFPCSGAIYVAVTGLLAARATFATGVLALLLYNVAFVAPLIILLAAAGNPYTTKRLEIWERQSARTLHVITSAVMVLVGAVILIFFV